MTAVDTPRAGSDRSSGGAKPFRIEREGDLAILWFDLPGEKVNKFSSTVLMAFDEILDEIAKSDAKKVLIVSAKPGIFIAGADVSEFTQVTSAAQAEEFIRFGQKTLTKLQKLPQITVAVIDGACLGGGTEMSINCDYRLMTDSPKARIGLPEVNLGIIPAWSGTTRLPRLVGLPTALDMILTGKTLDGRRAKKAGLVDEVIPAPIALEAAKSFASKLKSKRTKLGAHSHFYLEGNPLGRKMVFGKARSTVRSKTRGNYPAPLKVIDVMETGLSGGYEEGLKAEAREASQLIMGDVAQNLVKLFFLMEDAKKDRGPEPMPIEYAGVLGAGVMGGGIAQLVVDKADIEVRLRDINWNALAGGLKAANRIWKKKLERRRISKSEYGRKLSMITTTTDWSGFSRVDAVIEAVVENLDIKRAVLKEFEAVAKPEAIFATNTSTIPITKIAAEAARPQNVVGMHFFNPVDKMPLVEVISGEKTSPKTASTIASLARKLGKTVVMCNDGPGFVVNRILAPYMNEAAYILSEGNSIESIDEAMLEFGMPMGPMALLDEVGIDVASKAGHILSEAFGERMASAKALDALIADKRFGRKNGRGMYLWNEGKRTEPDPAVYKLAGVANPHPGNKAAMAERMVLAMVNEAARILDEKIVASAAELDLAMIMGTGFPPFRGGLLRYADTSGTRYVVARLNDLKEKHGVRFEPSAPLVRLAENEQTFYEAYPKK